MRRMLTTVLALAMMAIGATSTGAALIPSRETVPFFGLGAEHGNISAAQRATDLDRQAATGVGTMRENLRWNDIEPSPGKFDFTKLDAIVKDMAVRGLRIMPDLIYAPDFYTAKPAGATGSTQYPPKDPGSMAAFATKLVKRYGTHGTFWCKPLGLLAAIGLANKDCVKPYLPVTTWQVWNEPDFPAWWGGKPDAAAYTQLLTVVSKAIHKADRHAMVMTAGLTNRVVSTTDYLDQLYNDGAAKSFDVLAFHPYGKTVSTVIDYIRLLRAATVRHGDGKKPIALTEYGWADGGKNSDFITTTNCQAALIYALTRKLSDMSLELGIRSIYDFYWNDQPAGKSTAWPFFAGMVKTTGTAKPALGAFTAAVRNQPPPEGLTLEAACPPDRQSTT